MKTIEIASPSEDVGRDTLSRYDMQFQAAAYAALQILDDNGVDFVYCDYFDDFVVRIAKEGEVRYHFFQVKTKDRLNHQWGKNDVFAFKGRGQKADEESLKKVAKSFFGKLLTHGISFGDACQEATILSNIHFEQDVIDTIDGLRAGIPNGKVATYLLENFAAIFPQTPALSKADALNLLGKISIRPAVGYIDKDRASFSSAARTAIFKYSEIDLTFAETNALANGLLDLVFQKSKAPLAGIGKQEIQSLVGVGLDDLLEVLSISRSSYDALRKGTEPHALKQASAIQRWMKGAGASDGMIEYASQQKVNWDLWLRTARHTYSPMDLDRLLDQIDGLYETWYRSALGISSLSLLLEDLAQDEFLQKFSAVDRELLFGAVASVVVRVYSK